MANRDNFVWSLGDTPPPIEAHSIAKLDVLHGYLTRYVETLGAKVNVPTIRFDVVDGFAGGGLFSNSDGSLQNGSPITFLESIESARISIGEKRGRELDIDVNFYFIDKDPNAIAFLRQTLIDKGYEEKLGQQVNLINDEWENVHEAVISEIASRRKSGRAIFLLDQCGYTDVPLATAEKVLNKLPNSEIILNFATDFLATYLNDSEAFRKGLRKAGIDEKILDEPDIVAKSKEWRFVLEREISREIREKTNSHYSTPFYVVSEQSHNAYWLVHLCLHPKANDEMLKTHWDVGNLSRHYGGSGTDMHMWGYNANNDPDLAGILDFGFDELDLKRCSQSLKEELPRIVASASEGITFSRLEEVLRNNTVAWQGLIKETLIEIQSSTNDVEVITPNRNVRTSANGIGGDDLLRRPLQGIFDFSARKS